jgi:hypothetical protein
MFPIRFFYNEACNWSIEFLKIVNILKLYHILGSNHSTFYVWSFQVSFPYKFLVLKMRTLLFTKYMWKTITFHCLPSSRWLINNPKRRHLNVLAWFFCHDAFLTSDFPAAAFADLKFWCTFVADEDVVPIACESAVGKVAQYSAQGYKAFISLID